MLTFKMPVENYLFISEDDMCSQYTGVLGRYSAW